jgi:hypothetical protein
MARRASSKSSGLSILLMVLILGAAAAGTYVFMGQMSDAYRTLQPLDLPAYYENANSLRGNVYKIDAKVLHLLRYEPEQGRLFSVEVASDSGAAPIGVLIPPDFSRVNVQRGQQFRFKIEIGQDGLAVVRDLAKK